MKKTTIKGKFSLLILLLIFLIVGYQFQQNVKIMRKSPSEKWGKEVLISNGKISTNMKLVRYGDNYLAIHNDDFDYKLLIFDSLGNVIKEKRIESEDMSEIYNISLNVKDEYVYVNALTRGNNITYLKTFKLNDDLELISTEKRDLMKTVGFQNIDDKIFLLRDKNTIEIHDYNTGKTKVVDTSYNLDEVMGMKINDQYLIVYHAEDNYFYYFTYNNGQISESKPFLEKKKGISVSYDQPALAADNKNFYLMIDNIRKGKYNGTLLTQVNLESGQASSHKFTNLKTKDLKGFYSPKGARYIYTSPYTKQVVDILLKDGQIAERSNITRLKPLNIYSHLCDDIAIFAKFEERDFYNIYISSIEEEFKNLNNNLRKVDIKMAAEKEAKDLLNVVIYIFLLGTTWFLPLFAGACIYSIISFRLVKKNKIRSYFIFSIIGSFFKLFMIFNYYYSSGRINRGIFMNSILGVVASIIISVSIYGYYFYKYTVDTEGIFVERVLPPLIIDTLLTLLLFVPFAL